MLKTAQSIVISFLYVFLAEFAIASDKQDLKINDPAPLFISKLQDGSVFDLSTRKGKWTVLYFYPKAGTPGCTKQACAFRDSIEKIRKLGAEVYGVSSDSVAAQAKFHKEQNLNFSLIADEDGKIIKMYGTKIPLLTMSKRWTFIIDPELKIREIEKDVDPSQDPERVQSILLKLKESK